MGCKNIYAPTRYVYDVDYIKHGMYASEYQEEANCPFFCCGNNMWSNFDSTCMQLGDTHFLEYVWNQIF